jgi:ATP phosphoribosyltransferase
MDRSEIRLALPSKGRLAEEALELLANSGLQVYKPNPRQYMATIPSLPEVTVLFQRAGDIAVSIRDGAVDFGITGWDMVAENSTNGEVLTLLPHLGFGFCSLNVIVPEDWKEVREMDDLKIFQENFNRPLRVATKFPNCTKTFLEQHELDSVQLISAEGTLEIAPTIGYTDLIVDLVSSGTTLRDNRLRAIEDGRILESQACLIANRATLINNADVLSVARQLIEFIVAHLRAVENVAIFANMRGESPESIGKKMFTQDVIGGLQGPTISSIITQDGSSWYAVNIVVRKDQLAEAISELRAVGGSGVIVTPVNYIFEEEPEEYKQMLRALKQDES